MFLTFTHIMIKILANLFFPNRKRLETMTADLERVQEAADSLNSRLEEVKENLRSMSKSKEIYLENH